MPALAKEFTLDRVEAAPALKSERAHIASLDGLRGVAILLVVASHSFPYQLTSFVGWRGTFKNVLCSTGLGVQLFFVLSGFLITGILLDAKRSRSYFRNFYARRVLRIFPLYYGTLILISLIALFHGFGGSESFLRRLPWLLSYTPNVLMTLKDSWTSFNFGSISMGHFWSLAVEEQFYMIWPAVVLWCSTRVLKWLCIAAIPLGLAMRLLLYFGAQNTAGAFVFTPCQLDSLALGALISIAVREREEKVAALAWPFAISGGVAWVASCLDKHYLLTVGLTAFSIMSAGLLAICLYHRWGALFSNGPLRAFGKYSYAIYVFHVLLLPFVVPLREKMPLPLFTFLFAAISFLAGWLSWHLYEKHFLRLKRLFPADTSTAWRSELQLGTAS
jgi:peptidoglycan/LPS O-acetylase OafA/YrhL